MSLVGARAAAGEVCIETVGFAGTPAGLPIRRLRARRCRSWPPLGPSDRIRAAMAIGLPRFPRMDKAVLLAPAAVARAAAYRAGRPVERWLLRQPRAVRTSYVRDVLDGDGKSKAEEIWLLRQPRAACTSYVRDVLGAGRGSKAEEVWLLRQSKSVRESYIREVLGHGPAVRAPQSPQG